ncbi:Uma2 family endonuclease [Hymenobacter coalescens]
MAHPQPDKRIYTVEEYLALEEVSEVRHEYYRGEIFAMSGASLPHNRVLGNSYMALMNRLNPDVCEAFIDGALVEISSECYLYPDVIVSCHDEDLASDRILRHPSVIIEVLSPKTADYDRTSKLRLYQRLPSLQHYVLIRQDYCWVDCLTRAADEWSLRVYDSLTDELELSTLGITLPLAELYKRVKLQKPPQLSPDIR